LAKKKSSEESSNSMGWMVTFADLITLLLTFFVLLLTMCSLEAGKIEQLQAACADAMGVLLEGKYSQVEDRIITSSKKRIDEHVIKTDSFLNQFSGLKTKLLNEDKRGNIEFEELEHGLSIIIRDDFLFSIGRSEINQAARTVLEEVGTIIGDFEGRVVVEGHTDNIPITTREFPSNWELSTGRAVNVVKHLTEVVGVGPDKCSAVGYGDTRPKVPNDTPRNRQKNRRVEIILVPQIV
jgi:chemotaxis protein MotB